MSDIQRLADAIERLAKAIESCHFERIVGGVRSDPILPPCITCGGSGGFHRHDCPQLPVRF